MRARLAVMTLVALSVLPSLAAAHGRQPNLVSIALDPSDADHIVLTATYGVLETHDAGASWRWACAASFGADPLTESPDGVVTGDGSIVLGTFDGVVHAHPDLCDYDLPDDPLVSDVFVVDVARDPRNAQTVWALPSGGAADRVVRSEDGGRTWSAVGDPVAEILVERIALAPSDPSRIYVSGAIPPTAGRSRQAFVLRSDDGGGTFSRVEIPLLADERLPHVVGVDPTNADRIFVRMVRGEVDPRNERMLESVDGGQTFTSVLELPQMHGFAFSEDGQTIWIGSALGGGLWMAQGGTASFEQVNDVDVRCLESRGDTLFVCVDQLTASYAFGRSGDGGATIEPLLRFQDAQFLVECGACSAVNRDCPFWQRDFFTDLQIFFAGMEGIGEYPPDGGPLPVCMLDGGPVTPDAGPPLPPPSGCACAAARSQPSRGGLLIVLAVIGAVLARRVAMKRHSS